MQALIVKRNAVITNILTTIICRNVKAKGSNQSILKDDITKCCLLVIKLFSKLRLQRPLKRSPSYPLKTIYEHLCRHFHPSALLLDRHVVPALFECKASIFRISALTFWSRYSHTSRRLSWVFCSRELLRQVVNTCTAIQS